MALAVWPETLPIYFTASDYQESLSDGVLKDAYNVGPPSYRRRTTAAPENCSGTMMMTTAEWTTLRTFFHTTLFDGALRFLFPPQAAIDASRFWVTRFLTPPTRQLSDADDLWFVSLTLERLAINGAFILPDLFIDQTRIYAPRMIWDQIAFAVRYDNTNTFYAPSVPQEQFVVPLRLDTSDVFYQPAVFREGVLLVGTYSNTNTFYVPSVTSGEAGAGVVFDGGAFDVVVFD